MQDVNKLYTNDLSVEIISEFPKKDNISPDVLVSSIAFRTFDERELNELYKDNKIINIIEEVLRKGFASIGNIPQYLIKIEGPRTLDFIIIQSQYFPALVFSQRYRKDFTVYLPEKLLDNSDVENLIYKQFKFYQELQNNLSTNRSREISRRILPLGSGTEIYIVVNPENISNLIKYREVINGLTADFEIFINKLVDVFKDNRFVKAMYESSKFSESIDRIVFRESNESHSLLNFKTNIKILVPDEGELIKELKDLKEFYRVSLNYIIEKQREFLNGKLNAEELMQTYREFELVFNKKSESFVFRSSIVYYEGVISIVNWNELKRHKTINLWIEPIYSAIDETYKILSSVDIEDAVNNSDILKLVKTRIDIPKSVETNRSFLRMYLNITKEALELYYQLINSGIRKEEAVYMTPQNLRLKVRMSLTFDQLLNIYKFYGIRSCLAAEIGMLDFVYGFSRELLNYTRTNHPEIYEHLKEFLTPKCKYRCLEPYKRRKNLKCNIVLKNNPDYSRQFHKNLEKTSKKTRFDFNV